MQETRISVPWLTDEQNKHLNRIQAEGQRFPLAVEEVVHEAEYIATRVLNSSSIWPLARLEKASECSASNAREALNAEGDLGWNIDAHQNSALVFDPGSEEMIFIFMHGLSWYCVPCSQCFEYVESYFDFNLKYRIGRRLAMPLSEVSPGDHALVIHGIARRVLAINRQSSKNPEIDMRHVVLTGGLDFLLPGSLEVTCIRNGEFR